MKNLLVTSFAGAALLLGATAMPSFAAGTDPVEGLKLADVARLNTFIAISAAQCIAESVLK